MWITLAALAGVGFLIYWDKPNAVGGAAEFGLIVGVVAALIDYANGTHFKWLIISKWIVGCALVGMIAEIVRSLMNRSNRPE